jgi:hypothetical protein
VEEQDAVAQRDRIRQGYAQLTSRLPKGTLFFVQGELSTREYERTVTVPVGNKTVQHVIQQLAVELRADIIRGGRHVVRMPVYH